MYEDVLNDSYDLSSYTMSPSFNNLSPSFDNPNESMFLIGDIVQKFHLNNTDTNIFLQSLRDFPKNYKLPASNRQLWEHLNVNFVYEATFYCSNINCFEKLKSFHDKCFSNSCLSMKPQINSELLVFSVQTQLRRLVLMNYDLINWYSRSQNQYEADIVKGKHFD